MNGRAYRRSTASAVSSGACVEDERERSLIYGLGEETCLLPAAFPVETLLYGLGEEDSAVPAASASADSLCAVSAAQAAVHASGATAAGSPEASTFSG